MVNRDIVNFISGNRRRGLSYDEITQQLLGRGYTDFDILEARRYLENGLNMPRVEEYSSSKYGRKFIFTFFVVLLFVALIFFVFVMAFQDMDSKTFYVENSSLDIGVSLDLKSNNVINIKGYPDLKTFILKKDSESFEVLFGIDRSALYPGNKLMFDLDSDSDVDVYLEYKGDNVLFIKGVCVENWKCSDWQMCISGKQKRLCYDANYCETRENLPEMERDCILENVSVKTNSSN